MSKVHAILDDQDYEAKHVVNNQIVCLKATNHSMEPKDCLVAQFSTDKEIYEYPTWNKYRCLYERFASTSK